MTQLLDHFRGRRVIAVTEAAITDYVAKRQGEKVPGRESQPRQGTTPMKPPGVSGQRS